MEVIEKRFVTALNTYREREYARFAKASPEVQQKHRDVIEAICTNYTKIAINARKMVDLVRQYERMLEIGAAVGYPRLDEKQAKCQEIRECVANEIAELHKCILTLEGEGANHAETS